MSATTLVLLFQPWLSASGPGGSIRSDAFGRLAGTESQQDWGGAGLRNTEISGTWAVLTCVAILSTIFAAAAYLRTRAAIFSTAAAVAGSGVALFVLADVLYLDNKEAELRAAVADDSSFSGILRGLFGGAHVAHQLAGAHLDIAAMLAGITAFGAAACLLTNHLRETPIARTVSRPMTTLVEAARISAPTARPQQRMHTPPAPPIAPHPIPAAPHLAPAASHPAPAATGVAAAAPQPASIAQQPAPTPSHPAAPQPVPTAPLSVSAAARVVPLAPQPISAAPQLVPDTPAASHPAPAAGQLAPSAAHAAPDEATPPAPVVEFADITAERHEPAPSAAELPPFPARKQPSWRIVIPAGAVAAHAPARAERTFAR
ncbi:hypothetical protein [Nocardia cerradoensis]|uniref:hypothetical protein n=1 Tax=Nocardia cerradoensis TaxID=85688 RepID=UPI0012F670E8|nr:hypothetical protein [Nocardia cerradoensis]NKY46407.1 hypothetical protein [Nocardia cerradoensis]